MSVVLVTGATGFLGRAAVDALRRAGAEVHAIARRPPRGRPDVVWYSADLFDPGSVDAACSSSCADTLLHLAWCTQPGRYWTSPENAVWVDASLQLTRAFAANGGTRVVAAGSAAEYGRTIHQRAGLTTPIVPTSPYGKAKALFHRRLGESAAELGVAVAWGRVFQPYGPGEHPERLLPSVARNLWSGATVTCTAGTQVRDFIHVADVADAFALLAMGDTTGAFDLGTGRPTTVADAVIGLADVIGRRELVQLGARPTSRDEPPELVAEPSRTDKVLGWRAAIMLTDGLREVAAWWRPT